MGLLDGILGQVSGGEGNAVIANIAEKFGLTPEQTETAIGALASAHPQPGDTVQTASDNTGFSPNLLQQIVGHLGGEGGLASIASGLMGRGGEGGSVPDGGQQGNGIGGMLGGLTGSFLDRS